MADFSLKAVFGMDATGVKTELKQLRKEMGSFVETWAKLGAGAAIGAFAALGKGAIDLAGHLSDTASNIGINVVSLQALEAQHKRNGVSAEQLQTALQKTKAAVLEASGGNTKATAAFETLGLSVQKLLNLPLDKQYEAIGKAASKCKNENAAYNAVCEIFGDKVGPKMMGSLKELGEVGLPAVVKSARDAGQVMEKETIVALDRAGDAIDDFKKKATIAVGNILVNFRSEEGLKLLGLQIMKVLSEFGGGIVDAITEGGQLIGAVFKGAFRGAVNYLQDGMVESAKLIAGVMNKILPERFQIKVENLDELKSTGKGIGDEIVEAIANTQPSTFKKEAGEFWDKAIAGQKKVVDALNAKDFGPDAEKIEAAGRKTGEAIKKSADEVKDAGAKVQADIVEGARVLRSAMEGVMVAINRTGASYQDQSTASLEGVKSRLQSQIAQIERANFGRPTGVGGGGKPAELYLLQNELYNLTKELQLRKDAAAYAARFGEDAARGQFGDSITNRALQNLATDTTRTASAVENISKRLESVFGKA